MTRGEGQEIVLVRMAYMNTRNGFTNMVNAAPFETFEILVKSPKMKKMQTTVNNSEDFKILFFIFSFHL